MRCKADAGRCKADAGRCKADAGRYKADAGRCKADAGRCKADAGRCKADAGWCKADAGRCRALRTLGAKQKSGSLGRYKCKRFKQPRKRTVILHARHLTVVLLNVQASLQR